MFRHNTSAATRFRRFSTNVGIHYYGFRPSPFKIAPGYYLYQQRFQIKILSPSNALLGKIQLPTAIEKEIPELGKYLIYQDQVTIPIPIASSTEEILELQINYQGCATWGFCYPP